MSSPLDSDGFLYRECPICEREFKWLHTPEGDRDWRDPFRPVASGSSNSRAQGGLDESRPRCTVISSAVPLPIRFPCGGCAVLSLGPGRIPCGRT